MKIFSMCAASVLIFLMAVLAPVFGQRSDLPGTDVVRLTSKAERKLDAADFRMVLTTEWFSDQGDPINRLTETFAKIEPGRYRYTTERGPVIIETVVVDGRTFRRTNDEDWESVATSPATKTGDASTVARFGEFAGGASNPAGTGKVIARGTIDAQEVTMYEVRSTLRDNQKGGTVRTDTIQYWIDNDGRMVRRITEQTFSGVKQTMRSTANYFYTDIRIEAPILPVKENKD